MQDFRNPVEALVWNRASDEGEWVTFKNKSEAYAEVAGVCSSCDLVIRKVDGSIGDECPHCTDGEIVKWYAE